MLNISSGKLKVAVHPEEGGVLGSFSANIGGQWVDVLRNSSDTPKRRNSAMLIMAPLVNRTKDSKFCWRGRQFDLAHPFRPEDALHSTQLWVSTRVISASERAVELEMLRSRDAADFPYPGEYRCLTRYEVRDNALDVKISVENLGPEPIPAGPGSHMMCWKQIGEDAIPEIQFEAAEHYIMENQLPTGSVEPLPPHLDYSEMRTMESGLDDCVRGWSGHAVMRYPKSRFELHIDDLLGNCRHLQVWNMDQYKVCALEPMPIPPDAVNLYSQGTAGVTLPQLTSPGETFSVVHRYSVVPL